MDRSQVNAVQLQRRDPLAWTSLLVRHPELVDLVVTAVTAEPVVCDIAPTGYSRRVKRYLLSLANYHEPISLIAKNTNTTESHIYRLLTTRLKGLLPDHWYINDGNGAIGEGDEANFELEEFEQYDSEQTAPENSPPQKADHEAWLVMSDVANDYTPDRWTQQDVEDVVGDLADLHAAFWMSEQDTHTEEDEDHQTALETIDHFVGNPDDRYTWESLRREEAVYFDQGPGAIISDHALEHAGRLAPRFLQAANGLVVMRGLEGWPGVMGESHLAAVADLLDDPVPMLRPLLELPTTLLHGAPHSYHWRLSLFGDRRLIDWREAILGPGVLDLVYFVEQFPLLYARELRPSRHDWHYGARIQFPNNNRWGERGIYVRGEGPADEESIIDSYMLAMSMRLDSRFSARLVRQAIPAARCLYMLTQWFPLFATWFSDMPNPFMWQRANRMSDAELSSTILWPMVGYRRYLSGVFSRFLQAFRSL